MQVTYQTDLFLDKNKDYVVTEHQALLCASKCSFVSDLFPPVEDSTKATKFASIGSRFKVFEYLFSFFFYLTLKVTMIKIICCGIIFQQQLQALLETLSATEPHYIRCVKPNNLLKPAIFENHSVLQQLCCGVRIGLFTFFYCHWQLIHDKKKHSFFFFFEAGCHGGSKDKLFWISYKANLC